ncbi:MAG: PilZ domain-containing protein, partial [Desulfobulbia bacterium]
YSDERRESYRLVELSKATCNLIDGDDRIQGTLKNLSRSGIFIEADRQPDVSKQYGIEIVLQGSHSRLVVDDLYGVVTRADEEGVAVEFSKSFEWLVLAPIFF